MLRLSCFKFSAAVAAVFAAQLRSSYEFNTGLTRHVTLDKLTSNKRPAACHKDSKKYSFLPIRTWLTSFISAYLFGAHHIKGEENATVLIITVLVKCLVKCNGHKDPKIF